MHSTDVWNHRHIQPQRHRIEETVGGRSLRHDDPSRATWKAAIFSYPYDKRIPALTIAPFFTSHTSTSSRAGTYANFPLKTALEDALHTRPKASIDISTEDIRM